MITQEKYKKNEKNQGNSKLLYKRNTWGDIPMWRRNKGL